METATRPFGTRDKVGYALGDLGCNLSFSLISGFMLPFYTQYVVLPAKAYSAGIFLLKIWDAINDPLMGSIIDRRRIGAGSKFKPWIRIGSFGLVISAALFFLPVPNAPTAVKVLLFLLSYMVWDLCYTLVNVPYGAMNSTISAVPNERTQLSTWRSVGAALGGAFCMVLPYLLYDSNDVLLGNRLFPIALVMGIVAFFAYYGLRKMTTERVEASVSDEKVSYKKAVGAFFKNRPLLGLGLASFALIVFFNSAATATNQLLFQCYFHNTDLITIGMILSYAPMVFGVIFGGKLSAKFGKRAAAGVPFLLSIVGAVALCVLPITPDRPWLWIACLAVVNLGGGVFNIIVWAMVTDCIDYQQYKTGVREEGSVYAVYSLFRKFAQGVGAALINEVMVWAGYVGANGANQTAEAALGMKNAAAALILIGAVLVAVCLLFVFNLGKKQVEEMTAALGLAGRTIDANEAILNRND